MRLFPSRLLAVAALAFGFTASAEDPPPPSPQTVTIDVQVIGASAGPGGLDPRLESLQKRLKAFSFSSYKLISEQTLALTLNGKQTVTLPDNHSLEVTAREVEKSGKIRVHLHVIGGDKQSKLVDTEYAIEPGGDLVVGGMKHEDGALLVALHHHAGK